MCAAPRVTKKTLTMLKPKNITTAQRNEEEVEAIGAQAGAGAAIGAVRAGPAVVVAASAGAFEIAAVGRTPTVAAVVLAGAAGAAFDLRRCNYDRHRSPRRGLDG